MNIKIHVMRSGEVRVSPYLPFGGDNCSLLKASGITTPKSEWIWLPVFTFLIEHPNAKILFDTGWHREISPNGIFDMKAQIKSMRSLFLYAINQARIAKGEAVNEQLAAKGISPSELDYVLLSHLDCDHANGLHQVSDARNILVSSAELEGTRRFSLQNFIRYQKCWLSGTRLKTFEWNWTEGPAGKSYDLLGDGCVVMVNIPGHSEGLCALKIKNSLGKYVLLFSDGGYSSKSWKEMIISGISVDINMQKKSLKWIREQSISPNCIESIASHDANINQHIIII